MYHPRAIAEANPLEVTEIHLRGWSFPTNASPYAPAAGDWTQDQMLEKRIW
jgi:hypothetical protein